MLITHYVDLAPGSGRILFEVYGRILMVVHLTAKAGFPVAVDWPMMKDQRGGFGPVMRLLGEQEAVERCLGYRSPLVTAGLVLKLSETEPVPANATFTYGYRRSRKADKGSPSHLRRLERRALARGEPSPDISCDWIQARYAVPMQSRTSGQNFHLFIKRVPAASLTEGNPCSYGLGVLIPRFDGRGA